jgi:rRNA maturation endonuclease Nob1
MRHIKVIECHDCEKEFKVKDLFDDLKEEDTHYCIFCGSDNTVLNGS